MRYTPLFEPFGTQNSTRNSQSPCSRSVSRSTVRPAALLSRATSAADPLHAVGLIV